MTQMQQTVTKSPATQSPIALARRQLRPALIAALMLGVFANLAALAMPLYSIQVYDRVLTSRSLTTLVMVTLITAFVLAVYAGLDGLRAAILNRVGIGIDRTLSEPAFDAVLRARLAKPTTDAARAFRDVASIREFIASGGLTAFLDLPWVPVFVALSFAIHAALGWVAVVSTVLVAAAALASEALTRAPLLAAAQHQAEAQRHSAGTLRDAETISVLGMRGTMRAIFMGHHEAMLSRHVVATGFANVLLYLTKFVRFGVQIAIMGAAAYLVIDGAIQAGVIFAASLMIGRALAPVEQTVASWRRFVAAREALAKLTELFAACPGGDQPLELPRPAGRLNVEGICATAPGTGQPLLKSVSFTVEAGEMLVVIGASGSGKSSLVRVLTGIWPATAGAVRIDGATLSQWEPDQLGRHLGYVPQEITLFEGTIAQNIARHGQVDGAEVIKAARAAGVHEIILRLPQGYETRVGLSGETLSGGMRQRVALTRALYGDPSIVILDEPNSNLDPAGDQALAGAIAGLKAAGKTVVVVSHKRGLVGGADKVLVMTDGAVQAFGGRDQVMAKIGRPRVVGGTEAAAG
jgi:ATP-binding cassette, subfamily C, bacterial